MDQIKDRDYYRRHMNSSKRIFLVGVNYLNPAIADGFAKLLYPDSPRHPRQKYLLTVKGSTFIKSLQ